MLTALSITACLLSMFISWLVARGRLRLVYICGIVNGSLYVALNCILAASSPQQRGVLLLAVPSLWGMAMCVCGLRRLNNEGERK